jgi:transketolase
MPCTQIFDRQPGSWRHSVLPPAVPRIAVEAGHPDFWWKYVGPTGAVIGIAEFGESAPAGQLFEYFRINAAAVVDAARVRATRRKPDPKADPRPAATVR